MSESPIEVVTQEQLERAFFRASRQLPQRVPSFHEIGLAICQKAERNNQVARFRDWFHTIPRDDQDDILDKFAEAMSYAGGGAASMSTAMCYRLLGEAKEIIGECGLEMETKT